MVAAPLVKRGDERKEDTWLSYRARPISLPQTPNCHLLWALQTEKELDPEGLRKESEREQAILALTSTLDKLIKRLQENQSPELVQKYKKRRVVPQKPPPSPHPTGESSSQRAQPQRVCLPLPAPPSTVLSAGHPTASLLEEHACSMVCSVPTAWCSAWHTGRD